MRTTFRSFHTSCWIRRSSSAVSDTLGVAAGEESCTAAAFPHSLDIGSAPVASKVDGSNIWRAALAGPEQAEQVSVDVFAGWSKILGDRETSRFRRDVIQSRE